MVRAILGDTGDVLPSCVYLHGEYGIDDVYMSVPASLGRAGVLGVPSCDLNDAELSALRDVCRHHRRVPSTPLDWQEPERLGRSRHSGCRRRHASLAATRLRPDARNAVEAALASESSERARRILGQLDRQTTWIARTDVGADCQDTGTVWVWVELGESECLQGDLSRRSERVCRRGVSRARRSA